MRFAFATGHMTRAVKAILIACTALFVVQWLLPPGPELWLQHLAGLNVDGIRNGWVWQFITYAFLHGSLLHLLLNMLGLYFLGPELERTMGLKSFLSMYLFSAVLGGLGWFLLTLPYEGVCLGASGGIFGIIGAFAGLFPHRQLTLLLFFVLPVTMPAWLLAVLFGLFQLAYLMEPGHSGIAYAAHLAGGLAGFTFVKTVYRSGGWRRTRKNRSWTVNTTAEEPRQSEVDAVLDKITREGIHHLTAAERALLQRAGRNRR